MDSTIMDYQLNFKSIFWRVEKLYPDRTIVSRVLDETKTFTYATFANRVRRLASLLYSEELAGKPVASIAWNTYRHLELYFAVPLTGGVLHTVNVRFHPNEVDYVIDQLHDSSAFVDQDVYETVKPKVRTFLLNPEYDKLVDSMRPVKGFPDVDERKGAVSCFTSGTTGKPKGVVYSHRSVFIHSLALLSNDVLGISGKDVVLDVVPMFHISGWDIPFASLMTGAKLVLPGVRPRAKELVDLIKGEGVTVAAGAPTVWIDVMNYVQKEKEDLGRLRTAVMGGAEPPRGLMREMRKLGIRILHAWGMTETEAIATVNGKDDLDQLSKQGYPIPAFEIALLDTEGRELPWDGRTVGELAVRGAFVTGKYYGREESFTWFRTGDVATIDQDGNVKIVDRMKDLIKSGGEWISSVDLENAIMSFPKVLEAVVIGVPDPKWGERPVALVVAKEKTSQEEIVQYLQGLNSFPKWWLPDRIIFVDSIPKTSTGKLDKKTVREDVKKFLQNP
ncbi:long-chain fatty acid--CoA ligase [Metallosphaera tengchongensis]|uniref:Long-chain fatty acid--CoA ligase n=1 Tax=Metallosphaera tengchongensis TaxID=1532350 RepID=A0A6N0NX87_9CREN|nr:AMP-binding protein [Metallosphaera tengchongensis]QKR00815.1 long-chain fatty acid--CoA ligase [Metallosphaera tengchongensis]